MSKTNKELEQEALKDLEKYSEKVRKESNKRREWELDREDKKNRGRPRKENQK